MVIQDLFDKSYARLNVDDWKFDGNRDGIRPLSQVRPAPKSSTGSKENIGQNRLELQDSKPLGLSVIRRYGTLGRSAGAC